jgi:hypothetical protein
VRTMRGDERDEAAAKESKIKQNKAKQDKTR